MEVQWGLGVEFSSCLPVQSASKHPLIAFKEDKGSRTVIPQATLTETGHLSPTVCYM